MRPLVAGGSGYLGSVLIPRLLDQGYDVDVVELFWFGNHLPSQVGVLNKDIFHLTVNDLKLYEQMIFLAGLSNDPMAEYSPSKNFILNAAAPAYLGYIAGRSAGKGLQQDIVEVGRFVFRIEPKLFAARS
jgi:nucleoside-diphosphate-sugar epimerase